MNIVLNFLAVGLIAGTCLFLALGLYEVGLKRFLRDVKGEQGGVAGGMAIIFRRLGAVNRRFLWPSYENYIRKELIRGGEPHGYVPEEILALQEVAALAGLLLGIFVCFSTGWGFSVAFVLAILSGLYPIIWVNDQVKKRHFLITRSLPYNLDLLTLSVEAGLDFTAALGKVVEKGRHGPLRDEFQIVLKQLKMGKTREETLKAMMARVDHKALNSFIISLVQADKMGTSLGKVLRIQSAQLRIERTQRAEKLANEAPVKMLGPLLLCIFPTIFMILFGPIAFQFIYGNVTG